jgi:uncharacterized protein with PIN domain
MKFVVDCMLGKLAKWLKILGFDVVYDCRAEDGELLGLARKQRRLLLTRDHQLLERAGDVRSLFIESEKWPEQVEQVLGALNLKHQAKPYSRCLECNVELKRLPKSKAKNLVAPFILEHAACFALCPACGRVFWQGTHFEQMERRLGRLLGKNPGLERGKRRGAGKRRSQRLAK